jgi:glycosyltransferase involved in cell wall biosynthesis
MLQKLKTVEKPNALNRAAWHKPLISIVITHFNYADHIEDAILSLLDQTYENWECVVVDDASTYEQHAQLVTILNRIGSTKIRLVEHSENLGQIPAFFTGLDATNGEFICPFDPDDRYAETFLEEALAAHHHTSLFCPVVCTDQFMLKDGQVISGTTAKRGAFMRAGAEQNVLSFIPAHTPGWHWSSTSSMMLRRAALNYLRPHKPIITCRGVEKRALDSYLAPGAHQLGGTIFIKKPLIYRGIHANNSFISDNLCTSFQSAARPGAIAVTTDLAAYLKEVLNINGAPAIKNAPKTRKQLLAKWRRSFDKRWRKLFG